MTPIIFVVSALVILYGQNALKILITMVSVTYGRSISYEQSIDAMSSPEIKVDLTPGLYNIVIMYLDGKEKRDRLIIID